MAAAILGPLTMTLVSLAPAPPALSLSTSILVNYKMEEWDQ